MRIWCIAYINKDGLKVLEKELSLKPKFKDVEAYIPTVKVLKKKFKGKNHYDQVPLVFNYGFFKLDLSNATNVDYLNELRETVGAIHGWVKDPSAAFSEVILSEDNKETRINKTDLKVALATDEEIANLLKVSLQETLYSKDDIATLKVGAIVELHGYPFEGLTAKILEIKTNKKQVVVEIDLQKSFTKTTLSFDNVFYTHYKSRYGENNSKELSLEALQSNIESKSLDSLFAKVKYFENENHD